MPVSSDRAERLRFRVELLHGMIRRDVTGRYRGSMFGIAWSLVAPLLLLVVFTLAFHELLGARWPAVEGRSGFAMMVFAGMLVHAMLAETLVRAPVAISGNANYVKKLVFPLTVLPLVPVGAALFHAALSLLALLLVAALSGQAVHATALWAPVLLLPFVVGLCGLAWLLAALGVYLRDIAQLGALVATVFLFLSPIFYPVSTIPAKYQTLVGLNPLTFVVESLRAAIFDGVAPSPLPLLVYSAIAAAFAGLGLLLFRRLRPGFGDVL